MNIIRKAKLFLSLNISMKLLLLEAFIYLGWARILILRPFIEIAPSLGRHMAETSAAPAGANKLELRRVHEAIEIMSKYAPWESKCLVRAIAAMKMLERRRIESTLYLGTAKDEGRKMIAHAWLRSGPYYITGAEGMETFTVVGKFAKLMNEKVEGELDGQ
ncbi:lasso peptide biosynthesis B2 protein [Ferviditalea candida]|uniref:Lasso peptide biosynthesis B2 protein n=1 Tax=Ferviditalea candida TaxID=3108399 RepID=A0ABU5ZE36_9BACL|nr:lasso peptide biosynthesis B2 protein [Paenibacillaceae bacterium T2]